MQKTTLLIIALFWTSVSFSQACYDYVETIVKDNLVSCAFIEVANLDADPELEILLSTLQEVGGGPFPIEGALRMFNADQGINGPWTETVLIPRTTATPFVNTPQAMDVNEDGNIDILVQQGFLQTSGGSISWMEGPDFTNRYPLTPQVDRDSTDFYWHETVQVDLDNDGLLDLVTTSTNATAADSPADTKVEWFRHMGNGSFEHYIINDSIGGTFIELYDISGDGIEDIVISQFFGAPLEPSLRWLELTERPSASNNWQGVWNHHDIDRSTGLGYKMTFYDIDSDGSDELVYVNHNNQVNMGIVDADGNPYMSGLYYFEIPADPMTTAQWDKTTIAEDFPVDAFDFNNPYSQGAMGVFAIEDINDDNLPDIVVPGDGLDDLLAFINMDGSWKQETIDVGTMYGMALIEDLDNNGTLEIIAAKHNFPEDSAGAFNPPPGHLKIYSVEEITATQEHTSITSLELSPNPARNSLGLSLLSSLSQSFDLQLIDALGSVVYRETLAVQGSQTSTTQLDISDLAAGVYFLKLSNEEGITTSRFVKR